MDVRMLQRRISDARVAETVKQPDMRELVLWVSYLLDETDPIRSVDGNGSRSADPPLPHEPGRWVRGQQKRILEQIRSLSRDIQGVLKVPEEQRSIVDTSGKCALCGRYAKPPTRVSTTSNATGRATVLQQERIAELAGQVYGSVESMEKQIGVSVATLNRSEATRLVRTLKG